MRKINLILDKLNFPYTVTSISQFCREEDGTPYDVWKIETDSIMAVLKKTSPEERITCEAFFPCGGCGTPRIYGFAEHNGEIYMLMEFFEGETMSHCTREKLILALDALIHIQDLFWGNTDLADAGWTFEKRYTARKKRLAYMEDLSDAYKAYLEADSAIPYAMMICCPSTFWLAQIGQLSLTGSLQEFYLTPVRLHGSLLLEKKTRTLCSRCLWKTKNLQCSTTTFI